MSDVKSRGVRDFAKAYGISRSQAYEEINAGRLRTFNVGKRRLISDEASEDWRRDREREARALQPVTEPKTPGPSTDKAKTGKRGTPL